MNLLLAVYLVLLFSQDVSAACVNSYVVATSGTFVSPLTWCSTTAQITGAYSQSPEPNGPSYSFLLTGKQYTLTLRVDTFAWRKSYMDTITVSGCSTTSKSSCVSPVTLYTVSLVPVDINWPYSNFHWQVYIASLSTYLYFSDNFYRTDQWGQTLPNDTWYLTFSVIVTSSQYLHFAYTRNTATYDYIPPLWFISWTKGIPCVSGSTFSIQGYAPCTPCSFCGISQKSGCTTIADRTCCATGSTYSSTGHVPCTGSCTPSCSTGNYISTPCNTTSDIQCTTCKTSCPTGEYISASCSRTSNLQCTSCSSSCPTGFYKTGACSTRSDIQCTACTLTCPAGQFIQVACGGSNDIQCGGEWELLGLSAPANCNLCGGLPTYAYKINVANGAASQLSSQGFACEKGPYFIESLGSLNVQCGFAATCGFPCAGNQDYLLVTGPLTKYNSPSLGSLGNIGISNGEFTTASTAPVFTWVLALCLSPDETFLVSFDYNSKQIGIFSLITQSWSAIAGGANIYYTLPDGTGGEVAFDHVSDIVLTSDQSSAFLADYNTVRKITLATGTVTTLAGTYDIIQYRDGVGADARFGVITSLDIFKDSSFIWVADFSSHMIRQVVVATGATSAVVGAVDPATYYDYTQLPEAPRDGVGQSARIPQPLCIRFSPDYTTAYVSTNSPYQQIRTISVATLATGTLVSGGNTYSSLLRHVLPAPCVAGVGYSIRGIVPCTPCDVNCPTGSYRSSTCTITSNIGCTICTSCGVGKYLLSACTATSDTQCADCERCAYYNFPPTYTSSACTDTNNSICKACTSCGTGNYSSSPCSIFFDTVCSKCDVNCPTDSYMSSPCTRTRNTQCTNCTLCGVGKYLLSACTATSDTQCPDCDTCASYNFPPTYTRSPCTATTNTICTACTSCATGNYSSSPCNLSDTVCSKCDVCGPGQYFTMACTRRTNTGCNECPSNSYCTGQGGPQICPGTSVSPQRASNCSCPMGTYGIVTTQTAVCYQCPSNSYCTGQSSPQTCPGTSVSPQRSSSFLNCSCPVGTYGIVTALFANCSQCQPGTFCSGLSCQC